jgi:hypothetical protein
LALVSTERLSKWLAPRSRCSVPSLSM